MRRPIWRFDIGNGCFIRHRRSFYGLPVVGGVTLGALPAWMPGRTWVAGLAIVVVITGMVEFIVFPILDAQVTEGTFSRPVPIIGMA